MPIDATHPNPETAGFADQLERAFRGGAWHGPAFSENLAGLDAATAAARPVASAHSIWEIVLHAAAWIDICRRRIEGEPLDQVAEEEDWPPVPEATEPAWQAAVERLEEAHRRLRATVAELADERLDDPVAGSDPTVRGLLLGLLQHQSYHAGQIVVLRRAAEAAR